VPGSITPFTSLTRDNYFIGHSSGKSINGGKYNSFFGYQAGLLTRGDAGGESGMHNVFIGYKSGYQNTTVSVGYQAGNAITTGSNNIAIGYNAQVPNATVSNQIRMGNTSIETASIL